MHPMVKRLFLLVPLCVGLACGEEEDGRLRRDRGGDTGTEGSGGSDWGIGGGNTKTEPVPKPGTGGGGSGDGGTTTPPNTEVEPTRVLEQAQSMMSDAKALPAMLAGFAVDVSIAAAGISGAANMLSTGTVRHPEVNGGQWGYAASPSDRLVYVTKDGETSIRFVQFHGGAAASGEEFLEGDHDVSVVFEAPWGKLTASSMSRTDDGTTESSHVDGTTTDGCTWRYSSDKELSSSTVYGTVTAGSTREEVGDVTCGDEQASWKENEDWDFGQSASNYYDEHTRTFIWNWRKGALTWTIPDGEVSQFRKPHGIVGYYPKGKVMHAGQQVGELVSEKVPAGDAAHFLHTWIDIGGKRVKFSEVLIK